MKSDAVEPKSVFGRLRRKLSPKLKQDNLPVESHSDSARGCSSNDTQFQRVFDFFDEDGDGKVSAAELQSCVRTLGGEISMEEAETAVVSSDKDGDGLLGFDEFQKMIEGGESTEEEKKKELREAFGMYTMDGLGCITAASLRRTLSRLGESRSVDDCKTMIRAFDLNGDGVLSFDEFTVMMA
ncbi:hypothetical protein SLE2022_175470 [Rubroshorea leprosula]